MVAPLALASSTWAAMVSRAAALTNGPTSVAGSNGSPTDRAAIPDTKPSVKASAMSACTMNRLAAMHAWPAFRTRACTPTDTARSTSADGSTMNGSLPPSSSTTFFPAAPARAAGKKVVLELGGSDPFIVLPSADVDRAVSVGVQARVQNAGQSCIAAKRFIVHADIADAFTEGFVSGMAALSVGDPFEPATEVGPLVNAAARDTIAAQVEDARAKGATILCGGEPVVGPEGPDRPGFFYRPTVITGITPDMRAANEELFGPVALLYVVADADEALAVANATEFGLGSSVWTNDADEQQRFVNEIQAGQVFVNGMVVSMPQLPFGGIKSSGIGRELSSHGLHEFCNVKSVWIA